MTIARILLADDHEVVRTGIHKVVQELADIQVVVEVGDDSGYLCFLK